MGPMNFYKTFLSAQLVPSTTGGRQSRKSFWAFLNVKERMEIQLGFPADWGSSLQMVPGMADSTTKAAAFVAVTLQRACHNSFIEQLGLA